MVGAMTRSFIKAVECEPRGHLGRRFTSMKAIMTNAGGRNQCEGPIARAPARKVANFSRVTVRLAIAISMS
ncbi:unnamed protein product [Miscanthus lutarioriparius]|uniref:Uncharacterized protein n=1 Tax=Miscanthus lutarioriparius TaxID=422564 RepID=A0A811NB25_9POAL|nr:unnamed protein product [Miscanthus lutarioriparius]